MKIRRYKPGEAEELWQLYYDTTHLVIGKVYTKKQVERWAPCNKNMDEWKERVKEKNPFVAIKNDEIIGFAELEANGHIDYFYVHHKWQRNGVGSALYNAIKEEALRKKITYLYAEVSELAKDFFLKKGFKISKKKNNIVCGAPAVNYLLEKTLQAD